ncbi:MAG: hypothetical protein IJ545_04095 [Alphaproteobacteria bacterium]|nr:hypothetical protein [Alphaproteobacteria bacterium]
MAKNKKKYDLIFSVGNTCACSVLLRRNKLQYASYPLDWVGLDPFSDKIQWLLTHFEHFLNKESLVITERPSNEETDMNCEYCKDIKTGCYFVHDFPIGIPLEQSFADIESKYQRRIERLYQRLAKSKKTLIIWYSLDGRLDADELKESQQKLNKYFNPTQFDILVIENSKDVKGFQEENISEGITRITYDMFNIEPKSTMSSIIGNVVLADSIFRRYELQTPWWFKPMLKLIRCIPSKKFKKNLKRKIYNY